MARQIDLECSFSECDRSAWAKDLCRGHYAQQRRGRDLTPILLPQNTVRDDQGRKYCKTCGTWAAEEEFCRNVTTKDGLGTACRGCRQLYDLKRNYGLTPDEYDLLLTAQGNRCGICGKDAGQVGRNGWNIDHDHDCCPGIRTCGKCIRGLLCGYCNRGLGLFKDSPDLLRTAADYLDNRKANISSVEQMLLASLSTE